MNENNDSITELFITYTIECPKSLPIESDTFCGSRDPVNKCDEPL